MANKKLNQLVTKPSIASGDLFPIADATTGQLYKTTISDLGTAIGSGVSSVNGLVGAVVLDTDDIQELASPVNKWFTDLRARAAISVISPLAYNSGTGLITIAQATGSANGYLSSADWTTFNAKQAALSGTGFVKSTGGTISYDTNTYLTTSAAATNYVPYTGATANVNLGLNYSLTAALIIKSGGTSTQFLKADGSVDSNSYALTSQLHNAVTIGTANGLSLSTQVLSLGLASSTANGALSSTDWTTFNNKQNALTNPVTGTGTSGIVAVFNGTSSITDSTIYANSTRVSIGADITTTNRFTAVSSTTSAYAVVAQASSAAHGIWSNVLGTGEIFRGQTAGGSYFIINNGGNAFLNGNLNVGDFASTSYRLNVVGTANFTGALIGTSATFVASGTYTNFLIGTTSTTGAIIVDANRTNLILGAGTSNKIIFNNASTTQNGYIYSDASELSLGYPASGSFNVQKIGVGNVLTLASSGATTFSSSVTAIGTMFLQRASNGAITTLQFNNEAGANRAKITFGGTNEELAFFPGAGSSEAMRITSDGYSRLSSSSGGIQFNGDTASANALNDYEEGTFSPNAQPAGGGAFTTVTQSGSYVKVGKMVNYSFIITINSVGTGSGDVLITLPFVCGLTPIRPMGSGRENALYGNTLQVRTVSDGSAGALVIGGGILMNGWQALCTITYRTSA